MRPVRCEEITLAGGALPFFCSMTGDDIRRTTGMLHCGRTAGMCTCFAAPASARTARVSDPRMVDVIDIVRTWLGIDIFGAFLKVTQDTI